MNSKVKEFLEAAKAKEKKERNNHLISLGLIEREYSKEYDDNHTLYDYDKKQYFREEPVNVTDEEYKEIEKYVSKEVEVNNGAEKFLGVINTILLVIEIIAAIVLIIVSFDSYDGEIYFLSGLGVLLVSLISWSITKVLLNISNNLHQINSKLKG